MQPEVPFESIAIIGFGLIGASIAAAARQRRPDVVIVAIDVAEVVRAPAVQELASRVVAFDDQDAITEVIARADLTVLATPVGVIERTAPAYLQVARLLTDCGSTKAAICDAVAGHPRRAAYVPGHPMAGAPQGGYQYRNPDLFVGHPWLLCPPAPGLAPLAREEADRAHQQLERFAASLGARPQTLTPEAHDAAVAITSHLPQLLASHLVLQSAAHGASFTAGPGFDSATRVAGGNPAMWADIFRSNAPAVALAARELARRLNDSADALDRGALAAVVSVLEQARSARASGA